MADEVTPTETSQTTETPSASEAASEAIAAVETSETTALGGAGEAAPEAKTEEAAAPVVPETYELTPPEGMPLDADTMAEATPVFKELGLTQEQAQKLIPVAGNFAKKIADGLNQQILTQVAADRKAWMDTAKADPEIGGANWDKSIATAAMALDKLGYPKGSPLRVILDDSGLGNHPEMIRAFKRVGDAIGEDATFVRGDQTGSTQRTDAELFYGNSKT